MRTRGQKYWDWARNDVHVRDHDERLLDGTLINVQVRHCAELATQLFIGVYCARGVMLFEEAYSSRPGETMTQAIAWGVDRAKELLGPRGVARPNPANPDPLPRRRARKLI
jgi:hypothetical protein